MIKTVSFAPPRAAKTAAKTPSKAPGKVAGKVASAIPTRAASSPPANPSPTNSTARAKTSNPANSTNDRAEEAVATESTLPPRAAKVAVKKPRAAKNLGLEAETTVSPADQTPVKRRARKTVASSPVASSPVASSPVASSPVASSPVAAETASRVPKKRATSGEAPAPTVEAADASGQTAPKVRRSRVPKDLAAQYGGALEAEDAPRPVAEAPAPRKRLTRAKKEARTQMLQPDEGLLQRLQQANAVEVKKPASRGRGWEFECGRCGRVTRFQTPGAICECGAIAVRE